VINRGHVRGDPSAEQLTVNTDVGEAVERVVSVAEISPRGEEFDRTPPHDVSAEQCVLGGMLLSKDAISDVIEVIHPQDHYRPAHQIIHEAILDLYARGEPVDAITVGAELTKRGDLSRAGGGPYLHTLIASVPTAANAAYYARIVRERAILRRLIEVGTRIVQLGYSGDGEADELVDRAQAEVYGVTERRVSEDYLALSEIMPGTLDEIEAIGSRGGGMVGVPTGFSDLDSLTNGLHPGQMIVIAARPAVGKALALDTPLPTPTGWTTMGDVRVGDDLIGADGKPTRVVAATGVMRGRPCYAVEFNDGTAIVADAEHQWVTWDRDTRNAYDYSREPGDPPYPTDWATWESPRASHVTYRPTAQQQVRKLGRSALLTAGTRGLVATADPREWKHPAGEARDEIRTVPRTTVEIAETLRASGQLNHGIPAAKPLAVPPAGLPIDPYVLGSLLAHGGLAKPYGVATSLRDRVRLVEELPAAGHDVLAQAGSAGPGIAASKEKAPPAGQKDGRFIPQAYLRASFSQRLALAQGLIDSGGHVDRRGAYRFSSRSRQLVIDFAQLAAGLGCIPRVYRRGYRVRGWRVCRESWEVIVPAALPLARLPRKALVARHDLCRENASRYIVDVRPVPSVPVRCVQVDSADGLYLASRAWIPTHNSTLALDIARAAAVKHGLTAVIFSLEMGRNEITMRLLSAEARVPLHTMRTGQMTDDDWTRLARRMSEVAEAPLFIDDSPNMSMMEIRAKCRRLKQRQDLRIVIVDYLQLMSSAKRVENRQQEVSDMSRALKLLAKELDVPVVAISQLNRGPEQRTDKRPLLSDLRESGCLTVGTRILRADTGAEVSLGELLTSGESDIPVWSLDGRLRLVSATMTHAFPSGVKEVFRIRLASGREVEATANHPFLTYDGWKPLGELTQGSRLAVPRRTPAPLVPHELPEPEIVMLARLSHARFVPAGVFSLPKRQLALFVRHLWAIDGSVTVGKSGAARAHYHTTSERLARDLQILLLRFDIKSRLCSLGNTYGCPRWALAVHGTDDQERFLGVIGVYTERTTAVGDALAELRAMRAAGRLDTIPAAVWDRVRQVMDDRAAVLSSLPARVGTTAGGDMDPLIDPSRKPLRHIAGVLAAAELDMVATNDVYWDSIRSVESIGQQPVYDATVRGNHNFVANGISVHNSIEQDSDVVILLHREDAYERESPRAGEADLIVAKHRNGPTATVTVAFQGHYSRFVDMAPG